MDTNSIPKQALLYKTKRGVAWDFRRKDGRTKFILSVEEESFDGDGNELLPHLHPTHTSLFLSVQDVLSGKVVVQN